MNSWQQPVSGEPSMGTLHLIPEEDRNTTWDVSDSTISDTWEEADFGAYTPAGVKALLLYVEIRGSASETQPWLCIRKKGSSGTKLQSSVMILSALEEGSYRKVGGHLTVLCDSSGVIEYSQYSSAYHIDRVLMTIHGYYI